MILSTPSPLTFGTSSTSPHIGSVTFDLDSHSVVIMYDGGGGPGSAKVIRHAIPAALQTAIESHVQASIEAAEGLAAGSTSIQTP